MSCFFFSFNKFTMLKYIAPSHSLLVLCGVKCMGGSEDKWVSALYVDCVYGPGLEENLQRPKISYCAQKLSCWAFLLPDAQPRKSNSKASQSIMQAHCCLNNVLEGKCWGENTEHSRHIYMTKISKIYTNEI